MLALILLDGNAYQQAALAAGVDALATKAKLIADLLPAIRRVTQDNRSR